MSGRQWPRLILRSDCSVYRRCRSERVICWAKNDITSLLGISDHLLIRWKMWAWGSDRVSDCEHLLPTRSCRRLADRETVGCHLYLVLDTIFKHLDDCDACQCASSSNPDHPSRRVNICTGHVGATNQRIQNRCSTEGAPKIDHGKTHAVSFPDSAVLIRKITAKMELCGWLPSTEGSGSSGPTLCVHGSDRLLSDPLSGSKHL